MGDEGSKEEGGKEKEGQLERKGKDERRETDELLRKKKGKMSVNAQRRREGVWLS